MQSTELQLKERKNFGDNVRALRKERKLSQEKLAELADIEPPYLGKVERGECPTIPHIAESIAKALKCSLKDLAKVIRKN